MATEIKCEKKVIREIFNMWYCIPDYQRAYVWDTDQVRDLLDDTISAYRENKEAQYFLGSMVLKINEKSENNVFTRQHQKDYKQKCTKARHGRLSFDYYMNIVVFYLIILAFLY